MLTLLSERYAPITSSIGFLEAPLHEVEAAMRQWLHDVHGSVRSTNLAEELPAMLSRLPPLVGGSRPRELLVQTASNDWTAYFDCLLGGTDAVSFVGHMCTLLKCRGLMVRSQPHVASGPGRTRRYGAVQFELVGPEPTEFLNYVRVVSAAQDGSGWRFDTFGPVQPFEQAEAYGARRVRDRLTSSMLAAYCEAIGVRPFDPDFYRQHGVLFESATPISPGALILDLGAVQQRFGIVPGMADRLPG